jgi:hypothetical protein
MPTILRSSVLPWVPTDFTGRSFSGVAQWQSVRLFTGWLVVRIHPPEPSSEVATIKPRQTTASALSRVPRWEPNRPRNYSLQHTLEGAGSDQKVV